MLILTIIVGLLILTAVILAIIQNVKGLYRSIRSRQFGKHLYEKHGDPRSLPTTNYDLFQMIGPADYKMSYELRQTSYDREIPFRTIIQLKAKAEQIVPLPFELHLGPRGYAMDFSDEGIRQLSLDQEWMKALEAWADQPVFANLFLIDTEVLAFLKQIQKDYKYLIFSINSKGIELQLAGAFADPQDLSAMEFIMNNLVQIWEKTPEIIES